jgi:hypothetical protein
VDPFLVKEEGAILCYHFCAVSIFFEAFMTVGKAPTAFVLPEERVPLHHFYSKRV